MLQFVDPHFHIFDVTQGAYLEGCLFKPDGDGTYGRERYEKAMREAGVELLGGVFVECASVCYPGKSGEVMNKGTCLEEVAWVRKELGQGYVIVANCCLEVGREGVEEWIAAVKKIGGRSVRGVREILNYNPSYPRVGQELMDDPSWVEGLQVIAEHGMSFDLQLNPHQLQKAYHLFKSHPMPVILNHIGSPTPEHLTSPTYWSDLTQFASLPHAYIKISMLSKLTKDLPTLKPHILRIISIFTPQRSMFASNHPVDQYELGVSLADTISAYKIIVQDLPEVDRVRLFRGTAEEVYGVAERKLDPQPQP